MTDGTQLSAIETAVGRHEGVARVAVVSVRAGSATVFVEIAGVAPVSSLDLDALIHDDLGAIDVDLDFQYLLDLPEDADGQPDREDLSRRLGPTDSVADEQDVDPELVALLVELMGTAAEHRGFRRTTNFFAAGGDSLRALQVTNELTQRGYAVGVDDVVDHPTPLALARLLDGRPIVEPVDTTMVSFELISAADRAIVPGGIVDAYPLTALQQGMLFAQEYRGAGIHYHNVDTIRLSGPLSLRRLATALELVVRRNDVLRTSFDLTSYRIPLQLVRDSVTIPLTHVDLRAEVDPAEHDRRIAAIVDAELHTAFDVTAAPLVRLTAVEVGTSESVIVVTHHHAILDGWSLSEFLLDVADAYRADDVDDAVTMPAVPFSWYVKQELAAADDADSARFWHDQHELRPSVGETWPSTAPPASTSVDWAETSTPIDAGLYAAVRRRAETEGVSLKSVLFAAHLRVLGELSGRRRVVTGFATHGRPAHGRAQVGLYLNIVPVVQETSAGESWPDFLRRVDTTERSVHEHRRYPVAQHVGAGDGSASFLVLFNLTNFHMFGRTAALASTAAAETSYSRTSVPVSANFNVDEPTGELTLRLVCHPDAVRDAGGAGAVAALYLAALTAAAAAEHEVEAALSTRGPVGADSAWPDVPSVVSRVHEWATATPEAPAIVGADRSVSFGELVDASARVAGWIERHAGDSRRVGLVLPRSADVVIAALGTWEAGRSYVPIDPDLPEARVRRMLADAGVGALISAGSPAAAAAAYGRPVLDLDVVGEEPHPRLPVQAPAPDAPAYVLFTSGSTGAPKGVEVEHGSFARLLDDRRVWTPDDRSMLLISPPQFDGSLVEVWAPLVHGGTVVVVPSPLPVLADLARLVRGNEVDVAFLTGTLFNLLSAECPEVLTVLKRVLAGGEAISPATVEAALRINPRLDVAVVYGPTECAVYATLFSAGRSNAAVWRNQSSVPIGTAVAGTVLRVLDQRGNDAAAGAPGELVIGGRAVARGYIADPRQTAQAFRPDTSSDEIGRRAYCTGDLVRALAGGDLLFLGRGDSQVKVRGYRIELGEVESCLMEHERVTGAVVTVASGSPGDRLVAFVAGDPCRPIDPAAVTAWCRTRLPRYMVPAQVVVLPDLPRLASGKVDRQALIPPAQADRSERPTTVGATDLEVRLCAIWAEVLALDEVAPEENFFDLGGTSLTAMHLIARVREATTAVVEMRVLFDTPTVREMASAIESQRPRGWRDRVTASLRHRRGRRW